MASGLQSLPRIKSLLNHLRAGEVSLDALMQFVALDTLFDFSTIAVFLNVVRVDGSIHIPAVYGVDPKLLALIPERSVTVDTPATRSLRTGIIVECGDISTYQFASPDFPNIFFPTGFEFSFAWPIPGVGTVVTFCSKRTELTVEIKEFLQIVGSILALEFSSKNIGGEFWKYQIDHAPAITFALTSRQWAILLAMQQGKNNLEIARALGKSESLVRQESVQIFRKLGVSGRRQILESGIQYSAPEGTAQIFTI